VRKTEQRTLILQALKNCSPHPAAEEVYKQVRERMPGISLATVYRNLDRMTRLGLIRRLGSGGSRRRRYDPGTNAHGHFWCLSCGAVEDIPPDLQQPAIDRAHPWLRQRVVYTASTDYQGLCPRCAGGTGESPSKQENFL
jgi:Fur family ferric uptake transcriptional regulator